MLLLFTLAIGGVLCYRGMAAANKTPTGYGFGDPERAMLAGITIGVTAVLCLVMSLISKASLKEWSKEVAYTATARKFYKKEHGIEIDEDDDSEFLHLMCMSFVTIAVFSLGAVAQLIFTFTYLFAESNSVRINPPALQKGHMVWVTELVTTFAEIFIGYILYEVVTWFMGWEKYKIMSLVHHGGFLVMGIFVRGVEALPLVGSSAVAMEASSSFLVVHMIARQLEGCDKPSDIAFVIFAPMFIFCRLICYTAAIIELFILYFGYFDEVTPAVIGQPYFHIITWISFGGLALQWGWSPNLFKKIMSRWCGSKPKVSEDVEVPAVTPKVQDEMEDANAISHRQNELVNHTANI